MGWAGFLFVYLIGGLTFIPLVIVVILLHVYFTAPIHEDTAYREDQDSPILRPGEDVDTTKSSRKALGEDVLEWKKNDAEVAAAYFAIYREYVPFVPTTISAAKKSSTPLSPPNQNIYSNIYKSIFERKATPSPLDNKGVGTPQKKSGNVFYVVLR